MEVDSFSQKITVPESVFEIMQRNVVLTERVGALKKKFHLFYNDWFNPNENDKISLVKWSEVRIEKLLERYSSFHFLPKIAFYI